MNQMVKPSITAPGIDFFLTPDFLSDPYRFYHGLRGQGRMVKAPFGAWIATGYQDIAQMLRDKRMGKQFHKTIERKYGPGALDQPAIRGLSLNMLVLDPPDHTRLRSLVVQAFTARRVEEMRPRIAAIVDDLIDRVVQRGAMDVIWDFSHRLPVIVICDMLGIPEEDRGQFLDQSRVSTRLIDPAPLTPAEMDEANANSKYLSEYFTTLFERRRREPGPDLTTALLHAEDHGNKLTEEEVRSNIGLLFAAGHETTANLIGNGLLALHRNPDQLALLKARPDLIVNAVEELLRYDSSVQMTGRTALEDVECAGQTVRAGEPVMLLLGAANRDPDIYADPDKLDVTRANIRPLSFGGGIHHCLGAQLARIEAEIALKRLLERLPEMELTNIETPSWRRSFTLRGLEHLPACWPH